MLAPSVGAFVFQVKADCAKIALGGFLKQRILNDGDGHLAAIVERCAYGCGVLVYPSGEGAPGNRHASQALHVLADLVLRQALLRPALEKEQPCRVCPVFRFGPLLRQCSHLLRTGSVRGVCPRSGNLSHHFNLTASRPVNCSQRSMITSAYCGSYSIVKHRRFICSQAMRVLPLPPNKSSTICPGLELFLMR